MGSVTVSSLSSVVILLFYLTQKGVSSPLNSSDQEFIPFLYFERLNDNTTTPTRDTLTVAYLKSTEYSQISSSNPRKLKNSTSSANRKSTPMLPSPLLLLNASTQLHSFSAKTRQTLENLNLNEYEDDDGIIENPDLSDPDISEQETKFRFRGPNYGTTKPPRKPSSPIPPDFSPEDRRVRQDWGGSCTSAHWNHCSKITRWGGDYYVKDKKNPGKFILKYNEIPCFSHAEMGVLYCLSNGYTVARCQILCMSRCNTDYLTNYEKYIRLERPCPQPVD